MGVCDRASAMTDSRVWSSASLEPMDLSCAVGSRAVMATPSGEPHSGYPHELPLDLSTTTTAPPRSHYDGGYGYQREPYDCQYPSVSRQDAYTDARSWAAGGMKRYDGYPTVPPPPRASGACRYDSYPSGVMTEVDNYYRGGYSWHEPDQPPYPPGDHCKAGRHRNCMDGAYRPYRYDRQPDKHNVNDYYCWKHNGKYEYNQHDNVGPARRTISDCYRPYGDDMYNNDVIPNRTTCITSGGGFSYAHEQQQHPMMLPVKSAQCDINHKINKKNETLRKRLRQKEGLSDGCIQRTSNQYTDDAHVVIASNKHWAGGILSDVTPSGPSSQTRGSHDVINIPLHLLNTAAMDAFEDSKVGFNHNHSDTKECKTKGEKTNTKNCNDMSDNTKSATPPMKLGNYSTVRVKEEKPDG